MKLQQLFLTASISFWLLSAGAFSAVADEPGRRMLHDHVPKVVEHLQALGLLPASQRLNLAIGLPLQNQAALDVFLQQLYDPASPNYHQYLTPEQFTEKFGPTEEDYQKVIAFVQANGLTVVTTHANRVLLDVSGSATDVDRAFHITLRVYQHPREKRTFYSPDMEPSVDLGVPVADISGLNNYELPHPKYVKADSSNTAADATQKSGSGPNANYIGNDFRAAYVPGTALNGSGQMVGLLQFDGFYSNDIVAYENKAGLPNVSIQTNLLDNYDGTPGGGNVEVSLDIEMAISMAPGLSKVVVFEAGPSGIPNDILNAMAANSQIKQLSCSWGWSGGPSVTTDNIFKIMAAQGQSFFSASGDSDAFTTGSSSTNGVDNPSLDNSPSSSPYITEVGGTTMTMNGAGGSYASETVWNWGLDNGKYVGSSGGISSHYSIPDWQTNANAVAAQGSASFRNIPDVALTADNVYVAYGNGSSESVGGTSCAAPLWAGFMALVNQQAATHGEPSQGLINPAIYAIAQGTNYLSCFHDVTTGNNTWASSPGAFYAVPGYDLCTGLGTPAGTNLINALADPDPFVVVSNVGFNAIVPPAGTFNPISQTFYLTNVGVSSLDWSLINTSSWLDVSSGGGTLAAGAGDSVVVSLDNAASSLPPGVYSASLWFSNVTSGVTHYRPFTLTVADAMVILTTNNFSFAGPTGGPFVPAVQTIILTNAQLGVLNWGINNTSSWFNVSPASGALASGAQSSVSITLTPAATSFPSGIYNAVFQVTNLTSQFVQAVTGSVMVGQSIVQNGGFETGDFTGWVLNGDGYPDNFVDDGSFITPHSGSYCALLGEPGILKNISQTLPTAAGQKYLLSVWLNNPLKGNFSNPNEFKISWNGSVLYDKVNIAKLGWTNMLFVVTATGASTILQLAGLDNNSYLGLDDIAVTPVSAPVISIQPTNLTILSGNNAFFGVAVSGSIPLAYQWRKNGINFSNGGNVSGVTSNVLTFTAATTNNNANYRLVITNAYGSITSAVVTLTVNLLNTAITSASSENPAGYKDSLNFTAAVTPANVTGNVKFYTNGIIFDTEPLVAGNAASVSTAVLPRGTNQIAAVYSGDANDLPATSTFTQTVTNHPPVVAPYFTKRFIGLSLQIPVANLSSNWSDLDGDTISLAAIGVSTNGISVTNYAGTLVYYNPNTMNDEFTCTVIDGWGGTNFQNVYLTTLRLPDGATPAITGLFNNINNTISLNLAGASGFTYVLETTTNLAPPVGWLPVATNTLGTGGVWQFNDTTTNSPQKFYRLQLGQ